MEELFFELKQKVYEKLDINLDVSDEDLYKVIDVCIYEISQHRAISVHNRELFRQQLYNSILRLDILQELLEDDDITEIMINGYKDIFIEKKGRITKWNKQFESREKLEDIAQRIAAMSNKTINEAIPIVDTRLADGSRVNMVLSPIAIDGPVITIRKFYDTPIDIDRLIELGSITKEAADFLELLVKCRYNIFVSGGTGSGKTTFGKILSQKTGHEMIDLDVYLVNRFNMSIPDMFQISEDYFRNNETICCQEVSELEGKIISTGGVVINRPENIEYLKKNGVVFYIDRPIDDIVKDAEIMGSL